MKEEITNKHNRQTAGALTQTSPAPRAPTRQCTCPQWRRTPPAKIGGGAGWGGVGRGAAAASGGHEPCAQGRAQQRPRSGCSVGVLAAKQEANRTAYTNAQAGGTHLEEVGVQVGGNGLGQQRLARACRQQKGGEVWGCGSPASHEGRFMRGWAMPQRFPLVWAPTPTAGGGSPPAAPTLLPRPRCGCAPGGPYSSTPRGGLMPTRVNSSGLISGSSIASRSSLQQRGGAQGCVCAKGH